MGMPVTKNVRSTCQEVLWEKGVQACNFIKNRIQHMCFPVNIEKFLRTPPDEGFWNADKKSWVSLLVKEQLRAFVGVIDHYSSL